MARYLNLEKANKHARKSCACWNPNRVSRLWNRFCYRTMARDFYLSRKWIDRSVRYLYGEYSLNTYPWPYSDSGFANWREYPDNLITDQSNFVVKYATSYCAWKIFEYTGHWPQRCSKERFDAKRWVQFLAEAGYPNIVDKLERERHYVGINPNIGEYGLVVWAEGGAVENGHTTVSTYYNKEYCFTVVDVKQYIWVEISQTRERLVNTIFPSTKVALAG